MQKSVAGTVALWIIAAVWVAVPAHAQEPNQAGLVIVHGDGSVATECVSFATDELTGYELLQAANVDPIVEATGMGATVCSLDGEGCSFPQQDCFCECLGSPCVYWSYWRMDGDGWVYQSSGPSGVSVGDGDVEGWHWAEGTTNNAAEPPVITFAEICAEDSAPPANAPVPATAAPEPEQSQPSATLAPISAAPESDQRLGGALMWVVLLLGGAGMAGLIVWRLYGRRSGGQS